MRYEKELFRSVYGIKMMILTPNFGQKLTLHRIYKHPLPLYNPDKREAIRISNYVVQPVSCPFHVHFDGMKEPVLVLLDLRGGGAPPLRLTAPGTGGFDSI